MKENDKNIQMIRLISGEELIGVVDTKNNMYDLYNVFQVVLRNVDPTGQASFAFMPWPPMCDRKAYVKGNTPITLSERVILVVYQPKAEMIKKYNELVKEESASLSNLIVPKQGGIILN